MQFIGVDLAWGVDRPTGIAVLGGDGHLLALRSARTDDEIVAAVEPYATTRCVVAMDAPLVVANAAGNRPCEAALNRDFARFDAGAHPTNTGRRELAHGPRAARIAARLGLDTAPDSTAARRAIEVYPHPATISLFRLGRTLKYKQKTGRSLPLVRSELLRLARLLEGLADSSLPLHLTQHEGWHQLVREVGSATRKSGLRPAEDQIDAVVCAYVAMFADRRPDLTTVYGDHRTGYIVTPSLPSGHEPSRRGEPPTASGQPVPVSAATDPVRRAVQRYAEEQHLLKEATEGFVTLVTTLLDDSGINYLTVSGRTKTVASFAAKANREVAGRPQYADPLEDISDQIGVRVITYLQRDVTAVADLLADQLKILDDRDMGEETANEGRFGYASRHLLVAVDDDRAALAASARLRGRRAQIQVRTVLQHAWAEFEHAIRYKGTIPEEQVPDLDRRFTLAAGLLELADQEFSMIHDRLRATRADPDSGAETEAYRNDPRITPQDLATFLAARYPDAGWSRTDHYAWVSGLLLELGITSLGELDQLLTSVDTDAINARMAYRYPPGAVRRLDDALLAVFGSRYVALHGNAHRVALLQARLERLRTRPDGGGT